MAGFDNYDQWKTATPYDDEPDILDDLLKMAASIEKHKNNANWLLRYNSNISEMLRAAADYITENV